MTYLTLCVSARQECRIGGTGPAAVTGQSGLLRDIVDWVAQSYTELQQLHENWRWLRSPFTFNTVAGTDTYAYTDVTDSRLSATITRFSRWWEYDSEGCYPGISCYETATGVGNEQYLDFMPWAQFRQRYKFGTQTNARPSYFTIDPQNKLVLGPKPDAIYTITGEYQMSPQTLAADADAPEMPAQFHQLIVYMAMQKYGASKGVIEVFQRGNLEGGKVLDKLMINQLPTLTLDGPLT